nr:hypothetical transcript [Hymenolepis microstoma]
MERDFIINISSGSNLIQQSNSNKSSAKITPNRFTSTTNAVRFAASTKEVKGFGITGKPAFNTDFGRKNNNTKYLANVTSKDLIKDTGFPDNARENIAENVFFPGDSNRNVKKEKKWNGNILHNKNCSLRLVPWKQRLVALAAFLLLKAKYNSKSGKLIVFFATQDCVDFHHRLFSETLCKDSDSGQDEFRTNNLNFYRLHGNMDPKERQSVFLAFSGCPNGILFTTDVASRGLDLAGVAWVVQYHVSGTPIDYVHRVGRTARCGSRGKALLFLQSEEKSFIQLLASTVGVELKPLNLTDLLLTALYHIQNTKKKAEMNTVEEAASSMSRYFLQTVYEEGSELKVMAERAYLSFIRAYASFSGEMRLHFTFHRLHLGHVARAFCLNEAPSQISRGRSTKKRGDESTVDGSAKRSRRLKLDEIDEKSSEHQPSKKRQKVNPSKLAELNMLAEYGL